jgi:uncharacterized protein (UPF0333 family)
VYSSSCIFGRKAPGRIQHNSKQPVKSRYTARKNCSAVKKQIAGMGFSQSMQKINILQKKVNGNVLLELAIVFPVLILLISGIVQFGFILNAKIAVNSASYEASRAATLSADPFSAAMSAASDYAGGNLPGWDLSSRLKVNVQAPDVSPGSEVKVEVIYSVPVFFSKIVPFSNWQNAYTDVRGVSVMRIEEKE